MDNKEKSPSRSLTTDGDYGVNAVELAVWCDITVKTVNEYVHKGIFNRVGPNLFALRANVISYLRSLRRSASGRSGESGVERGKLLAAQARIAEIKEAQMRGERVHKEDVIAEWSNVIRQIRSRMLALPSRLGGRLPHLTPADRAEIDAEIRAILTELGDYNSFADDGYVPVDLRPAPTPATEPMDRDDDQAA